MGFKRRTISRGQIGSSRLTEYMHEGDAANSCIVCAPHGGDIERFTFEQAHRTRECLSRKVDFWGCKGFAPRSAYQRWHITSTEIGGHRFRYLDVVGQHPYRYAVAFHGFRRSGVLIGGAAPASLKATLKDAITAALAGSGIVVRVAKRGDSHGGFDPCNFVNRLAPGHGIQLDVDVHVC